MPERLNEGAVELEPARKRLRAKSRWLRFGLRRMFLLVAVAADLLAISVKRLRDRKASIMAMRQAGGTMGYSIDGPEWLRKLDHDEECFLDPKRVSLGSLSQPNPDLNDAILCALGEAPLDFRNLEVMEIPGTAITDASASCLGRLTSLTHRRLTNTQVADKTIREIRRLPNLQYPLLANTKISDACIDDLCQFTTLVDLQIMGTAITDAGVVELRKGLPAWKTAR